MGLYDAIYARQSVDRADSISMESQIAYCKYEVRGGEYRVFGDRGYSGKNTDRPQFQELLSAIRLREVKRVICYKLDRISRSILDFATMMAEFQQYSVEFVSCTEKFDTSTPMGRAMLNLCIVFAQLERETIQMRVTDAYVSRSRRGFYMGGRVPYGYRREPFVLDGKKTSRYVMVPEEAEVVQTIYSLYAQPNTSLGDVSRYLKEQGIQNVGAKNGVWSRSRLADLIKNPVYVRADWKLYRFYREQGARLYNSPEDYVGIFGCYLYADKDAGQKSCDLEGQHVVLAPHEGIVASEVWLRARMKCLRNKPSACHLKAKHTWLTGRVKCGKCGYALTVRSCKLKTKTLRYLMCSHRMNAGGCEGVGGIRVEVLEELILSELLEHLKEFPTLKQPKGTEETGYISAFNQKIEQLDAEAEHLLDRLSDADEILMDYIKQRIRMLEEKKNRFRQQLHAFMQQDREGQGNRTELRNYMGYWEKLSLDDKCAVVNQLIGVIRATQDHIEITWNL